MSIRSFDDDDAAYLQWVAEHPDGYVINTRRRLSPDYVVLHTARCHTILNERTEPGGWTQRGYVKYCANDAEGIAAAARAAGRPDGTPSKQCERCNPVLGNENP
jgi:hypothetical protein